MNKEDFNVLFPCTLGFLNLEKHRTVTAAFSYDLEERKKDGYKNLKCSQTSAPAWSCRGPTGKLSTAKIMFSKILYEIRNWGKTGTKK